MDDHRDWPTVVAYWAKDLPAEEDDATELHLMGCARCTSDSQRVAVLTEAVRRSKPRARAPFQRRAWMVGAGSAVFVSVASAAVFLLLAHGPLSATYALPAPVRGSVTVEIAPPPSVKEIRLELRGAATNGVRVRRAGGEWIASKAAAGPPFTVILDRSALTTGDYEIEAVWATADGQESPRGFYRFWVSPGAP